jgi:hypothetical protein
MQTQAMSLSVQQGKTWMTGPSPVMTGAGRRLRTAMTVAGGYARISGRAQIVAGDSAPAADCAPAYAKRMPLAVNAARMRPNITRRTAN